MDSAEGDNDNDDDGVKVVLDVVADAGDLGMCIRSTSVANAMRPQLRRHNKDFRTRRFVSCCSGTGTFSSIFPIDLSQPPLHSLPVLFMQFPNCEFYSI